MKTFITTFFVFSLSFCFAQSKVVTEFHEYFFAGESSKFRNSHTVHFKYNNQGQVIEATTLDANGDYRRRIEQQDIWEYREDGQLSGHVQHRWERKLRKWEPQLSLSHYKSYDNNGCMTREYFWEDWPSEKFVHEYEYYDNCQKSIFYDTEDKTRKFVYEDNQNSFEKPYELLRYDEDSGWKKYGSGVEYYDEKLRLREHLQSNHNDEPFELKEYQYDEYGNFTSYKKFWFTNLEGETSLIYADSIEIIYDDEGKIELTRKYSYDKYNGATYNFIESERYLYFCDGLLKSKSREIFSGTYQHYRISYEYETFSDCEESSEIEFSISPNPARNKIEIKSYLFEKEYTFIRMYDFSGRLVLNKLNATRSHNYFIEIRNMEAGIYFVEIQNGQERATQKLLIK